MKVTVEVDCTPEEARRFLGLPVVVPIQQAIMEKLQQRMLSTIDATAPEAQRSSFHQAALTETCRAAAIPVAKLLPSETPDNQYRVKNLRDNHERVVRESQLRRLNLQQLRTEPPLTRARRSDVEIRNWCCWADRIMGRAWIIQVYRRRKSWRSR